MSLSFTCKFHRLFFSTLLQEELHSQKMGIWKELEPKWFLCLSQLKFPDEAERDAEC